MTIDSRSVLVKKETKNIVDLDISTMTYEEVLENIYSLAAARNPSYVCFANAHMAVEAHLNKKLADSINQATIVASDGMSVVMALKFIHKVKQDRTAGMDMIYDIVSGAGRNKFSVFLFGTNQSTLDRFINKAKSDQPDLMIAGAIAPPYTNFTKNENEDFINTINQSNANIVLVSLGCPKQEKWMAENSHRVNAVMLGIGGALSLYANKTKRAPEFMQKYCLEWLYRLSQEPGRLWKRYLITNTLFIIYFLKQLIRKNIRSKS